MKKPRVLVLNHAAQPRSAAGGTRHVEMFSQVEGWDHSIVAARYSYLSQERVPNGKNFSTVAVSKYRGNGVSRILTWATYSMNALVAGLTGPRPTVVYGSSPHMGAALAGWIVAKVRRAGFVLEVRDLWPHILAESGMMSDQSRIFQALKKLERFLYRRADSIVILAEGSADYIVAEGVEASKIVFVPNGADPADFDVAEDRTALRSEFGLDGFCLVYAGAHGPANGLHFALEAAQQLSSEGVHFHLVGAGVSKEQLIADASSRNLENVHFHEPIPKQDIKRLFAAADAGLHCLDDHDLFTKGVSPNKLYDYMAAGLPVVTNTRGEVAALVEEAGSGFAVGPTEIADAVRSLKRLPEQDLSNLGLNGRSWMEANRSRAAMAHRVADVLNSSAGQ